MRPFDGFKRGGKMTLLYPLFAMVLLYLILMPYMGFLRLKSVQNHQMTMEDYKIFDPSKLPGRVGLSTRNFANLFEVPMLFFVAVLLILHLQLEDRVFVQLAWAYVAFRYLHTFIHVFNNQVMPRFYAFALSNVCLTAIWIRLALLSS